MGKWWFPSHATYWHKSRTVQLGLEMWTLSCFLISSWKACWSSRMGSGDTSMTATGQGRNIPGGRTHQPYWKSAGRRLWWMLAHSVSSLIHFWCQRVESKNFFNSGTWNVTWSQSPDLISFHETWIWNYGEAGMHLAGKKVVLEPAGCHSNTRITQAASSWSRQLLWVVLFCKVVWESFLETHTRGCFFNPLHNSVKHLKHCNKSLNTVNLECWWLAKLWASNTLTIWVRYCVGRKC